jgi:hypothetical protein
MRFVSDDDCNHSLFGAAFMHETAPSAPESRPLIDRLKCFNAKERYWVVRQALGHFHPSDTFVRSTAQAAGVAAPDQCAQSVVFLAMDYHLNWLHAALTGQEPDGEPIPNQRLGFDAASHEERFQIENSQEDIDLLLAYLRPDGWTQIILIEAKCTSGFTMEQLQSKATRLCGILKDARLTENRIDIKLVLLSPDGSQSLKSLKSARDYCKEHGAGELIPEPKSGKESGWLPLVVRPLDPKGFWVVKFGTGKQSSAETDARRAIGNAKQRYFWKTWRLTHRRAVEGGN